MKSQEYYDKHRAQSAGHEVVGDVDHIRVEQAEQISAAGA